MQKRVGIITLQKSPVNYGAALQCFALWKYVSSQGYECEVVDILRACHKGYQHCEEFGEQNTVTKKTLKSFMKDILINKSWKYKQRYRLFSDFNNQISYSRAYKSVKELSLNPPKYDVYLTGSDQVWNPNMPIYNGSYFWEFNQGGGHKVSYASSFSVDTIPEEIKPKYSIWLKGYDYLSVRENSGVEIIKELTGRECKVVLDPVFLLSSKEWEAIEKPSIKSSDYIFVYLIKNDNTYIDKAVQFSKKIGLPLYVVTSQTDYIRTKTVKQLFNVGPREWLGLINHASYVITDSFHGTSMSAIFQKPFVTFINKAKTINSRINTILEVLGLDNHIVFRDAQDSLCEDIFIYNYHEASVKLEKLVLNSKSYLNQALSTK